MESRDGNKLPTELKNETEAAGSVPSNEEGYKEFCRKIAPYSSKTMYSFYLRRDVEYKEMTPAVNNPYKSAFSEQYESFYASFSASAKPQPLREFQDLLSSSFIVGESHSQISPKRFLCENLPYLKEQGYEALFMEHLYYDSQADLDEFFNTGEMPVRLKNHLTELDNGHGLFITDEAKNSWAQNNFTAIVTEARKAGIRIIAIDISHVYGLQGRRAREERVPEMNYGAYKIMSSEIERNHYTKWIALMGNSHAIRCDNKPTPGMDELMGVRSLLFFDEQNPHLDIRLNSKCTKRHAGGQGEASRDITFHGDAIVFANHSTSLKDIFSGEKITSNGLPQPESNVIPSDVIHKADREQHTADSMQISRSEIPISESRENVVLPGPPESVSKDSSIKENTKGDLSVEETNGTNMEIKVESGVTDPVSLFKSDIQKNVINELIREAMRLIIIYDTGNQRSAYLQKLPNAKLPLNGRIPLSVELPTSLPSEADLNIRDTNAHDRLRALRETITGINAVLENIGPQYNINDRDSQINLKDALEGVIRTYLPQYDCKYSSISKNGRIILNIATAFTLVLPLIKKYLTGTAGLWYSPKGKTDQAGNKALNNVIKAQAFEDIRPPSMLKRFSKR